MQQHQTLVPILTLDLDFSRFISVTSSLLPTRARNGLLFLSFFLLNHDLVFSPPAERVVQVEQPPLFPSTLASSWS